MANYTSHGGYPNYNLLQRDMIPAEQSHITHT